MVNYSYSLYARRVYNYVNKRYPMASELFKIQRFFLLLNRKRFNTF